MQTAAKSAAKWMIRTVVQSRITGRRQVFNSGGKVTFIFTPEQFNRLETGERRVQVEEDGVRLRKHQQVTEEEGKKGNWKSKDKRRGV